MRGRIAVAGLLVVAVAGFFIARAKGLVGDGKIHIGVVLPLSGPDASAGRGMRNAIQLAADEANARGGVQGRAVELEVRDDASDAKVAAEAVRGIVADKRIIGCIEHYDPAVSQATRFVLDKGGLPNIVAGVSTREIADSSMAETEHRLIPYGAVSMAAAVQYAWKMLGLRKPIYFRDGSPLGKAMVFQFRAALGALLEHRVSGGDTILDSANPDYAAAIARVHNEAPDFILYGGGPVGAAALLVQLRGAGYTGLFQVATHYPSQEFIDAAGDKAEGAIQVFHGLPPEDTPGGKAFLEAYAAHGFHEPAGPYGLYAYAEAQALIGAIDRSFLTRPSVQGALLHEKLDTALGPIQFNYFGSTYQTAVVYQVIHGHWTPILVTDATGKLQPVPPK